MQRQKKRSILYKKYLEQHPQNVVERVQEPEPIEKDEFEDLRIVLYGLVLIVKKIIMFVICLGIFVLAAIGAIALYVEPIRRMIFETVILNIF